MELLFKSSLEHVARTVEAGAGLLVIIGVIQALIRVIKLLTHPKDWSAEEIRKENIRLSFGRWLSLALEFALASDILLTAVAPTWNDIGKLTAIIILRTVLNYFLQRENQMAVSIQQRMAQSDAGTAG